MASVGKASLTIVPKFDNLGKSVTAALNGVDTTSSGVKMGAGIAAGVERGAGGLVKSGALVGIFSAVTTRAMDLISSSVDGAVSRFDTLNNYPRVMQALGYSADSAQTSISKMSDHLTGLPTALNDMTSTVQGIAAITGDLDQATDAGLALNDMLLASGSSTVLTSAAMEQFRQMLAKGVPEMQDWKSLTSAMPGQMNQLAQAMLGPTANANDLYTALGGGGGEATISMDQLMAKMVELDTTGSDSFTSFADQAKAATGGVESSMSNMQTAVERGLAGVLDSIGTDTISDTLKGIGSAFESALGIVGDGITAVKPFVSSFVGVIKEIGPSAVPAIAGLAGLAAAGKGLNGLASVATNGLGILNGVKGVANGVSDSLLTLATRFKDGSKASEGLFKASGVLSGAMGGPLVLGITAAVTAAGFLVGAYMDAQKKSDTFKEATTGLSDAVAKATELDSYKGTIDGVGESASFTALSVDELTDSLANHAKKISENNEEAQSQITQLDAAQQIIDDYAGQTDLSTEAQGRLKWALHLVNEQFGLTLSASDVARGAYQNTNGDVVNLKDSINDLVEAKKNEIRLTSLSNSLTEAYAAEEEAASTLAATQAESNSRYEEWINNYIAMTGKSREEAEAAASQSSALADVNGELSKAKEEYKRTSEAANDLEKELGDSSVAATDAADAYDKWGNSLSKLFTATLKQKGTTLSDLKDDLRALGANTDDLARLSEDDLMRVANSYDGTSSSIVGALDDLGVGMDETKKKTALAADEIKSALSGMGDEVGAALEGVDVSAFSQKLAEAGVSTEQLNQIGSDNLAQLAEACGGNMDAMVFYIQHYNDTPILDKDGSVQVDKASLVDAEGHVYTWNGTELIDKDGNAVVDDVSLTDAQGNAWTWNGTSLSNQYGTAQVGGNMKAAIDDRDNWNNGNIFDKTARATIDIFRNITDFFTGGSQNAAGGFRLNAAGGYRFHADGAIVNKAVPLDIVGEDGSEAIVPLSNKRYSVPFARTLAEQMSVVSPQSDGDMAAQIAALRADLRQLYSELGQIIKDNAPVVVKTPRQARIDAREVNRG